MKINLSQTDLCILKRLSQKLFKVKETTLEMSNKIKRKTMKKIKFLNPLKSNI